MIRRDPGIGETLRLRTQDRMAESVTDICDRAPLMQRLTASYDDGLLVWVATDKSFSANLMSVKREADLVRMFSVVLARNWMEDTADDDYLAYCKQLGEAAEQLLQAIKETDAAGARDSVSKVGEACLECHVDYRG